MLRGRMAIRHDLELEVRYSETDQMGIVHHASYLVWLEEGRTALMGAIGLPYHELERTGIGFGVRKVDVRYRQAVRYGDRVRVRTTLEESRGASLRFGYEVLRCSDRAVALTGTVEIACIELAKVRPTPLPRAVVAAIEAAGP